MSSIIKNANEISKIFLTDSYPSSPHDYPQKGFWLDKRDGELIWTNERCLTSGIHHPKIIKAPTAKLLNAFINISKHFKRYKHLDFRTVRKPVDKLDLIIGSPALLMIHSVMSSSLWNISTNAECAKFSNKDINENIFICWDDHPEGNGFFSCSEQGFTLSIWNIPYVIRNTGRKQPKSFDIING